MGKIRIKTLGIEELEQEQKEKTKVKKEQKKARKTAKGAHGGERVVAMGPTEEELEQLSVVSSQPSDAGKSVVGSSVETGKQKTDKRLSENRKRKTDNRKQRQRSKRYRDALVQVDRTKAYPLSEAVSLLKKIGGVKFDGTVELHINTTEKGNLGQISLPHGIGKKLRVKVASDALIACIEKGTIDFDILVSHPSQMAKLAKVAKVLGPRGLMPNPKSGTISEKPEQLAKTLEEGNQLQLKTESQAPILHLAVGKVSMKDQDLAENIAALLKAVDTSKVRSITLKSTMSPGIKLDHASL